MIPWDYNLAFGTFQGGNAQSTVNTPIDAPVSGGSGEDRPMWSWILSDESYTELYHQYFAEFLNTVDIQEIIDNAYNLIQPYVEKDPTAFYTYEEFETGVETMRQFCDLRSESISMQLANGETTSNMSYVDASGLTLSDMGSMGGKGGNSGGMPDRDRNKGNFGGRGLSDNTTSTKSNADESTSADMNIQGTSTSAAESMPQNSGMPAMPEGFDSSQMQGGFGGMFPGGASDETGTAPSDNSDNTDSTNNSNRPSRDNMQMPGGNFNPNMDNMGNATSSSTNWVWLAVSFAVLGVGLLIAKLYKH